MEHDTVKTPQPKKHDQTEIKKSCFGFELKLKKIIFGFKLKFKNVILVSIETFSKSSLMKPSRILLY
jgi:hypothetical protein